jgi:hypothetical protein
MAEIDHKYVVRGALELMKLPDSVKIASHYDNIVTVNRQKSPGTIWKERQVMLDFEKWPVVILKRQGGDWDPPITKDDKLLFKKIEVNVAAPTGSHQLGRAIEMLLGL